MVLSASLVHSTRSVLLSARSCGITSWFLIVLFRKNELLYPVSFGLYKQIARPQSGWSRLMASRKLNDVMICWPPRVHPAWSVRTAYYAKNVTNRFLFVILDKLRIVYQNSISHFTHTFGGRGDISRLSRASSALKLPVVLAISLPISRLLTLLGAPSNRDSVVPELSPTSNLDSVV